MGKFGRKHIERIQQHCKRENLLNIWLESVRLFHGSILSKTESQLKMYLQMIYLKLLHYLNLLFFIEILTRLYCVCLNNKKHDRSWDEYDVDEESRTYLESSRQDARQCALIFQRPLKVNISSRHLPFVLANQNIAYCCGFFNKML